MQELIEGIDYYFNEDGLIVLTEKYHRDRGYCCGNGCLHCPYNSGEPPNDPGGKDTSRGEANSSS